MLVPAILYRDGIINNMRKFFYTDDMMYETGSLDNWVPEIVDEPDASNMQYAIIDDDKFLIGLLTYRINWYSDNASNFGLFSFDRGNPIIGKDVCAELERLVKRHRRVEWRMVGGNPVEKAYDHFLKRHNGNKYILKDAIRDKDGNYHNDIIYEIMKGDNDGK